jgi:uncharacterized membrane protein
MQARFVVESQLFTEADNMQAIILAAFFDSSRTVIGMCAAGLALFVIGVSASTKNIANARGLEKILALTNLCFAIPLAIFGALHLFGPQFVMNIVPPYMPFRMFWAYAVGVALIAASLSIATRIGVRWSGLLFGIMMFLFVAMIHFPGALRTPHERIIWVIVFREMSFGGAAWILAANATNNAQARRTMIIVGRVLITMALIVFGVEHFLFPTGLPGVPLPKQLPEWLPGRVLIDYVTGAAFLVAALSVLLSRKTRVVATCVGGWLLLLVVVIYGPVLITSLAQSNTGIQIEGINYFADTLLFAAVILSLASAAPPDDAIESAKVPRPLPA